jgi:hypothetical protein
MPLSRQEVSVALSFSQLLRRTIAWKKPAEAGGDILSRFIGSNNKRATTKEQEQNNNVQTFKKRTKVAFLWLPPKMRRLWSPLPMSFTAAVNSS